MLVTVPSCSAVRWFLAGYPEGSAEKVGVAFRSLYYRHNIEQRMTAMIFHMAYSSTSWGWLGVPFFS